MDGPTPGIRDKSATTLLGVLCRLASQTDWCSTDVLILAVSYVLGIPGWCPAVRFTRQLTEPAQFDLELLDGQANHPNRLVITVANFRLDRTQRVLLSLECLFQELFAQTNLFQENTGLCLPGQGQPGKKSGPVLLVGPVLAIESVR